MSAFREHIMFLTTTWLDTDIRVLAQSLHATSEASLEGWLRNYVKEAVSRTVKLEDDTHAPVRYACDLLDAAIGQINFEALAKRYWDKHESRRQRDRKGITT